MDPLTFPRVLPSSSKVSKNALYNSLTMRHQGGLSNPMSEKQITRRKIEEHSYYLAVIVDEDGNMQTRSSLPQKRARQVFLEEAIDRMQEIARMTALHDTSLHTNKRSFHEIEPESADPDTDLEASLSYPFRPKRHRLDYGSSSLESSFNSGSRLPITTTGQGMKQPKLPGRKDSSAIRPMISIRADETERWHQWFSDAFRAIQQTGCRLISKEWIKGIHPKKQSTHPYNGNIPRGRKASPERTKPDYWPPHVRHKEPDHIDRADRVELLVYIIQNTPQREVTPENDSDKFFRAVDLLEILRKKQDEGLLKKWDVIKQIVDAREFLENYEDGGCDPDAEITVCDYFVETSRSASSRKLGNVTRASSPDDDGEDLKDQIDDDAAMAPLTTVQGTSTSGDCVDENAQMAALGMSFSSDASYPTVDIKMEGQSRDHVRNDRPTTIVERLDSFHLLSGACNPPGLIVNQLCPVDFYGQPLNIENMPMSTPDWSSQKQATTHESDRAMVLAHPDIHSLDKDMFLAGSSQQFDSTMMQNMMQSNACFDPAYYVHTGTIPTPDIRFQPDHNQAPEVDEHHQQQQLLQNNGHGHAQHHDPSMYSAFNSLGSFYHVSQNM